MTGKRTYGDSCGVARALDVVGERWALLVVRELLLGPKRFTDLRSGLPHVGPDVLSQRLRELEQSGLLRRAELPPPAGSRVYELTDRGRELEPVILALGRWGSGAPFPGSGSEPAAFGADSAALALKTLFSPSLAADLEGSFGLTLGDRSFRVRVRARELQLLTGAPEDPDATIETDPATLAAVLWHGTGLATALRAGEVRISGDRRAARRFLTLFPLPPAPAHGSAAANCASRCGESPMRIRGGSGTI